MLTFTGIIALLTALGEVVTQPIWHWTEERLDDLQQALRRAFIWPFILIVVGTLMNYGFQSHFPLIVLGILQIAFAIRLATSHTVLRSAGFLLGADALLDIGKGVQLSPFRIHEIFNHDVDWERTKRAASLTIFGKALLFAALAFGFFCLIVGVLPIWNLPLYWSLVLVLSLMLIGLCLTPWAKDEPAIKKYGLRIALCIAAFCITYMLWDPFNELTNHLFTLFPKIVVAIILLAASGLLPGGKDGQWKWAKTFCALWGIGILSMLLYGWWYGPSTVNASSASGQMLDSAPIAGKDLKGTQAYLDYSSASWNGYGPGKDDERMPVQHLWMAKSGQIAYALNAQGIDRSKPSVVVARMSSELSKTTSTDPVFASDVTLTVNGKLVGVKPVIPDNISGADAVWNVPVGFLHDGVNQVVFSVKGGKQNGLCIYSPIKIWQ